jgi:hypothetical protein
VLDDSCNDQAGKRKQGQERQEHDETEKEMRRLGSSDFAAYILFDRLRGSVYYHLRMRVGILEGVHVEASRLSQ